VLAIACACMPAGPATKRQTVCLQLVDASGIPLWKLVRVLAQLTVCSCLLHQYLAGQTQPWPIGSYAVVAVA
jgi:hypothetical protein